MASTMPDVANHGSPHREGTLDWVGMSHIELPLRVALEAGVERQVSARVEALVDLPDPQAKGIHMSRLYLQLDRLASDGTLDHQSLSQLLDGFVSSHEGLSTAARVSFAFDYHLRRGSLLSGKQGWKAYPVTLAGVLNQGQVAIELAVEVPYSSTCPCSAALARQLIQQAFDQAFADSDGLTASEVRSWLGTSAGIVATPHSQRSVAQIRVKLAPGTASLPLLALIDGVEAALKTPVQAAVKREDEQEFARLNGQNLMFCEDAARHLQHALNEMTQFDDYYIRVNHYESLHAHDAVAIVTKGIPGGYRY